MATNKNTTINELYRTLSDLHDAMRPHVMRMGVKKGFHELVALEVANKMLLKHKVQS